MAYAIYERVNFQNSPSTATPINADNLNALDEGISVAFDMLSGVDKTPSAVSVPLAAGWLATDGVSNTADQMFYSKSGVVRSTTVYTVEVPASATTLICTLPTELRAGYPILAVGYAQIAGSPNLMPTTLTINPNGEVRLPMLPPQAFVMTVEYNFFSGNLTTSD